MNPDGTMNNEWMEQAGFNAMIVTPMFGFFRMVERWKKTPHEDTRDLTKEVDLMDIINAEKEVKAVENVQANVGDIKLTNNIIQDMYKLKENLNGIKLDAKTYKDNIDRYFRILERANGDYSKLAPDEIAFLTGEGARALLEMQGKMQYLSENPQILKDAIRRKAKDKGLELSDAELDIAVNRNNNNIEIIRDVFNTIENTLTGRGKGEAEGIPIEEAPLSDRLYEKPRKLKIEDVEVEVHTNIEDRIYNNPDVKMSTKDLQNRINQEKYVDGELRSEQDLIARLRQLESDLLPQKAKEKPQRWKYEPLDAEKDAANSRTAQPIKDLIEKYDGLKTLDENNKIGLINSIVSRISGAKNPIQDAQRALGELNKLMIHSGKTSLGDLNRFDTIKYFDSELARLKSEGKVENIGSTRTSDLNIIAKVLLEDGVIGKVFSSAAINKKYVKEQNIRSKKAGRAGGQEAIEINAAINRLADGKSKKTTLDDKGKITLKLMNELAVRDLEINGLKWKHFNEKTGTIDLTTAEAGKGSGLSRFMYLDDATVKLLTSIKGNPNAKIFGAKGAHVITKALQLEANNPKATAKNLRKIAEAKAEGTNLTELEAAVWERITGHTLKKASNERTRVADIYGNLNNPGMAKAFQKAVFDKILFGKGRGITKKLQKQYQEQLPTIEVKYQAKDVKPDQSGTPEQQVKFYEDQVASIKKSIKIEKDRIQIEYDKGNIPTKESGTLENLQSQLKGAGFSLYAAKKKLPQFQREAKGAPTAAPEMISFLRQMAKSNPNVKIKTIEGADYAAKFQEGVIYVTLGKANKGSWYHENAHALEKMIFDTGNKELMAIWKQGEKLFKNDAKAAGESVKEFIPDQIQAYAEGRLANKSVASKMRAWTGRLWTKIKQVFFGKSSLNKNDIVKILGEKVYKGFARTPKAEGLSMPQYQFANNTDRAKFVKKNFNDAIKLTGKKMSNQDKKILVSYIAQQARIENPNLFRLGSGTMKQADIIAFDNKISSVSFKDLVKLADIGKRINKWMKVSDLEEGFIPREDRPALLNLFGVPKGKIEMASSKQLNQYISYLTKKRYPDSTPFEASIQHENMKNVASQLDIKDVGTLRRILYAGAGETASVIEALGAKSLANKLRRHDSKESDLIGDFNKFERIAEKELGAAFGGTIETPLQIRKGFGKQKEGMSMLDLERYAERLNTGALNRQQKKFMSKAVKKDAVVVKDGKYVINKKYKEDITRALNLDTPQGRVAKEWNNLTETFKTELDSALRGHFKSESDYQAWLNKTGGIGWITENFYMYRKLTPEMMQVMGKGRGGAYQKKIEESIALDMAKKSALEKYGSNVTEEQIRTEMLEVFPVAQEAVNQMFKFNKGKLANAIYIKNRHRIKLPEFVKIDGKKIEVYETSYDATIKEYALGMSKLIANIKEFPDMVDWVSKRGNVMNMSGQSAKWGTKTALRELEANRKWGDYIKDAVNRKLGIHETATGLGAEIGGVGEKLATVFAKTALGFPTHGGVNLIYGQAMSLHSWKFRDYFRAILKSTSSDFREDVRRRGALELGLKNITSMSSQGFFDWIFSWGGMRQTENINRYIDVAASTYETTRLIRTIQHKGPNTRKYKKAINRLKDFYHLEDNQINLLKKYGEYGIDGHSGLTSFQKGKTRKELLDIEQQLRHYAHVNVQGASGNLFQPGWATGKMAKPLTLFWRMAYASSANKVKTFNNARKNGDYLKLMMMGLSPVMAGMAISGMYNWAIGTPKIKENASWYEWYKSMLLRGEVVGFATNGLRILDGQSAEFAISPALITWTDTMIDAVRAPIQGEKTVLQSSDDFLKATFSGYRNTIRAIEARKYPDKVKEAKYGRLWNDFLEEVAPNQVKPKADYDLTTLSPVYRDFRSVFRKGTPEEIAKQYIVSLFSLASEIYRLDTDIQGKPLNPNKKEEQALKDAESRLKRVISHMNPNPISFFDKLEAENQKDLAPHWLEYLKKDPVKYKEYVTEMATLESKYRNKLHALRVNKMLPEYIKDDAVMKSIKKSLRTIAYHKSIK
jgi:integrase